MTMTDKVVGYPHSLGELETYSMRRDLLDANTFYFDGMMRDRKSSIKAFGDFGLCQLDTYTHLPVALMGFCVSDAVLTITHTPQPFRPATIKAESPRSLARLRSRDFRGELMQRVLTIAEIMKISDVRAVPAAFYQNVVSGLTDYYYVYERVDEVLKRYSFILIGATYILRK